MSQTYLTFPDYASAHSADVQVAQYRIAKYNAHGGEWSGVSTNGTLYGIAWAAEVEQVFGPATNSDGTPNPNVVLAEEVIGQDGKSDWEAYVPPTPETPLD